MLAVAIYSQVLILIVCQSWSKERMRRYRTAHTESSTNLGLLSNSQVQRAGVS